MIKGGDRYVAYMYQKLNCGNINYKIIYRSSEVWVPYMFVMISYTNKSSEDLLYSKNTCFQEFKWVSSHHEKSNYKLKEVYKVKYMDIKLMHAI